MRTPVRQCGLPALNCVLNAALTLHGVGEGRVTLTELLAYAVPFAAARGGGPYPLKANVLAKCASMKGLRMCFMSSESWTPHSLLVRHFPNNSSASSQNSAMEHVLGGMSLMDPFGKASLTDGAFEIAGCLMRVSGV